MSMIAFGQSAEVRGSNPRLAEISVALCQRAPSENCEATQLEPSLSIGVQRAVTCPATDTAIKGRRKPLLCRTWAEHRTLALPMTFRVNDRVLFQTRWQGKLPATIAKISHRGIWLRFDDDTHFRPMCIQWSRVREQLIRR